MFPDIPPPLELPPDQQRRYMFASLGDYVGRVAAIQPRLYILDDLHWADESTLLFLEYLAEQLGSIPVLVVGTYRNLPVDVSPLLAGTLSAFVRHHQALLLSIKRHSESEVMSMLEALSGHAPPPEVTAAIYAETEGNAFFVEEVFRHLAETGALLDHEGRFRGDLRIDELDVPDNVRLVTGQRLNRLGEAAQRVLTLAAVIGRHCSVELLEAIGEVTGDALIDAVEESELARLVFLESVGSQTHLWFSHELIRQTLLARLSELRRRRYHVAVADALERLHVDELDVHAIDIASQLVQAGHAADQEKTTRYLMLAGDRALEAAAYEEALRHFEKALQLTPARDAQRRAKLLLRMGLAQRAISRWDDMVATCNVLFPTLESLGSHEAVAAACWDLGMHLGWAIRFADALTITERGLSIVGERSGRHRARILAARAHGLSQANRFEEASAHLVEARTLAQSVADERLLGEIAYMETFYGVTTMEPRLAREAGRAATTTLRGAGTLWDLATALAFWDCGCLFADTFDESDQVCRELEPLAERIGSVGAASLARRNGFPKAAARGQDLEALDALASLQAKAAQSMGADWWVVESDMLRGIVEFWKGDWEAARRHMEKAVDHAPTGHRFGIHHGFPAVLLALSGHGRDVVALLDELDDTLPTAGRPSAIGQWNLAVLAAEAVGVLRDDGRARLLYPMVIEALSTGTVMRQGDGALLERAAAMAAAVAGLSDEAEKHFEVALRQTDELPHAMERPSVLHFYARFLIDRAGASDLDRVHAMLTEAIAGYQAVRMPRHQAMTEELSSRCASDAGLATRCPVQPSGRSGGGRRPDLEFLLGG